MNHYETVCIVKPDLGDEAVKSIIQKASTAVTSAGGEIHRVDEWGRRKLAYPILKKNEGYYFVLSFSSDAAASHEVGRILRLNEDVLRHQTVRLEEPPKKEEPASAEAAAPAEGGQA